MLSLEDILSLSAFLGVCLVAASSGAIFKPDLWYQELRKPRWCPPNWLFPAAWSILYLTIAVSGHLVWRVDGFNGAEIAFMVFGGHLVLNFVWSVIFFGLRRIDWAFFEIVLFWLTLVGTILLFYEISTIAAYLLLPYLVWATFAGFLNYTVWQMNKAVLFKSRSAN